MPQHQEVKASLGCGTLILIAVIVMIFGGNQNHDKLERSVDSLSREVNQLRSDIGELRQAMEDLKAQQARQAEAPAP